MYNYSSFNKNVLEIIEFYIETDKIEENVMSKIKLSFVESITDTINTIRPELKENGLNTDILKEFSGYTLCLIDNTIVVLLDKEFFTNNINKNIIWIEVLIHEYTHAIDYLSNIGLFGHVTLDEMLKCMPFWYWSEFHARYKGNIYMLKVLTNFPLEEKLKYIESMCKDIAVYCKDINSNLQYRMKIYKTMHMIADIIAFEELFPFEVNKIIIDLQKTFEQFGDFKEYMNQFKNGFEKDEILQLPNACRQFLDNKL